MRLTPRTVAAVLVCAACAGAVREGVNGGATLALGRAVFDESCAVCHSVAPPPRLAPPMSHVARHYLETAPDSAEAAHRIERWIAAPAPERSALPSHAIDQWGLMPPLQLNTQRRRAVARYVLTLASGAADEHESDAAGRGMQHRDGPGMQHRHGMQHGGMQHGGMQHGAMAGMQPRAVQAPSLTPEVEAAVARIAEPAANALRTGLMRRLGAALQAGPPERAIDVCAVDALPLTDSIAAATGADVSLKRTSTRIRNPRNTPDALEGEALRWFEEEFAAGREPASLVQAEGADAYRFYAPLRVAAPCLSCHGPEAALAPAVRRALLQRYPADRATGYSEGDLRGLIRVRVPASAVQTR